MSLFVVFVYPMPWFSAATLTSAAMNDINLYNDIQKFTEVHSKVYTATSSVIKPHTRKLVPDGRAGSSLPI